MIDERTKKILLAIIKHCNVINETKEHFGDSYKEFEENNIYQNAILTRFRGIWYYSPRTKKRLSDRRQSHYDKNGGITHDTTVFALALKIY